MPRATLLLAIFAPTVFLWELDARALQRGTWVIEQGTKLGWDFRGLEIECVLSPLLALSSLASLTLPRPLAGRPSSSS